MNTYVVEVTLTVNAPTEEEAEEKARDAVKINPFIGHPGVEDVEVIGVLYEVDDPSEVTIRRKKKHHPSG